MSSALSSLLKKSSLDDHEQILTECNKVLKSSKNADVEAQRLKVVALVKLDRYQDAVEFVEKVGDSLQQEVALEYAYALYKVGRLNDAADLASTLKSRGAQHVEAQSQYRLENSSRTINLYKQIRSQVSDQEDFDLRVNQGAIDAQAQWLGLIATDSIRRPGREDLEYFETAYNAACGSIARGEFTQAEMLLKRAKELCKHSNDLTDQQKSDEILPISIQQLYVLLCLGKTAEAEALADEIEIDKTPDLSTRKVGQSNVLLTSAASNPFLAHKIFHATPKVSSSDRLFSYQNTSLESNKNTIDLQSFKFDGIISSTAKLLNAQSGPSLATESLLASYFNASAHAGSETGKAAIRKILPQLQRRPHDVGLVVTLIQLYVNCGDITSAIDVLENFFKGLEESGKEDQQDIRFSPMLVSLMVSLYHKRGQKEGTTKELAKAAAHWRTRSNAPISLLTAAGISLLASQDLQDAKLASDIFAKLRKEQPSDKATAAGFVASHADDQTSSGTYADKLTPISELVRNIDIDALERTGILQSSNAAAIAQLGRSRKRGAPEAANAKPKRIRKSRLPKDFEEGKKPDPERWLPMKDRSYYRPPKGKKKNKRGGGDTQGGAVDESLNVDAKPAASTVVSTSSGGGGNKKKKGKGKK
jgi:signal recognition particle subunit SRP72